jgi:hypothetical protein
VTIAGAQALARLIKENRELKEQRAALADRLTELAFRPDGGLRTMGYYILDDGTKSAAFCCSCEENADGVRRLIEELQ